MDNLRKMSGGSMENCRLNRCRIDTFDCRV